MNLSMVYDSFLRHKRAAGVAENTVKQLYTLSPFVCWVGSRTLSLELVEEWFLLKRERRPVSATSLRTYLVLIKGFVRWLERARYPGVDVRILDMPLPRASQHLRPTLHRDELRKLLHTAQSLGALPGVVVALMLFSGCRRDELRRLQLSSVRGTQLFIHGKGNKKRVMPMCADLREAVARWLSERPECALPDLLICLAPRTGFGRKRGDLRPVPYWRLAEILARVVDKAGVQRVTPHDLRANFCRQALWRGLDIWSVKGLMGHARLATTEGYLAGAVNPEIDTKIEALCL